ERQHRGSDHGSTRAGPQNQIHRGRGLPQQTGPTMQAVQRRPETVQHLVSGCKMLAGTAYTEKHNQVAGIVYRNVCAEYRLEVPKSKWETPPKVVENGRAKVLWDFKFQTDKQLLANQPDMVVVDKEQKRAVVIDVAVPADSNIRKKEHQKIQKYQGLKEELERMWKVKSKVVPVVTGALGAVIPKLGAWLQEIPGTTSEVSVQKNAVLGTAKILQNPQSPRPLVEDPSLRKTQTTTPWRSEREIYIYIYIKQVEKQVRSMEAPPHNFQDLKDLLLTFWCQIHRTPSEV
ncbi:hypothetical protein LDENG_00060930, partial [Lucifuga dentata]